jgi:uncharacterized protein YkwD
MSDFIIPFLFFIGGITFIGNIMNPPLPYNSNQIHNAINNERTKLGLQPLVYSAKLESIAYNRSLVISTNEVLEHGPNWSFEIKTAYPAWKEVGENLADGHETVEQLVKDWMNSPEHKANIVGNYNTTGISVSKGKIRGEEKVIVVQTFLNI